jgi:hypothetical protein
LKVGCKLHEICTLKFEQAKTGLKHLAKAEMVFEDNNPGPSTFHYIRSLQVA